MSIDCTKLAQALNTGCPTPSRLYGEVGWIASYEDVYDTVISNNVAVFKMKSGFVEIFDRSVKPFNGTMVNGEPGDYYMKFSETVQFPLLDNTFANAFSLDKIKKGKVIVVLEQLGVNASSKYQVFGLDGGLKLSNNTGDASSDIAYLASLTSTYAKHSAVFLDGTEAPYMLNYDWIGGLTINDGSSLQMDTDPSFGEAYYYNSSGIRVASISGVVDTTWSGGASDRLQLLVPKASGLSLTGSYIAGELSTTITGYVEIRASISKAHAPQSLDIDLADNYLDAQAIEVLLSELVQAGGENGVVSLFGNAAFGAWTSNAILYKNLLVSKGWTILYTT